MRAVNKLIKRASRCSIDAMKCVARRSNVFQVGKELSK